VATSGFVGRIDSETRIAFWSDDPTDHGFDPAKLISVDLERTPGTAIAGEIPFDAVEVDDCFSGPNGVIGGTTLGPRWPELSLLGVVYLESRFRDRIPDALRPPCPPTGMGTRPHEFMAVAYWPETDDPRAGQRYVGHHARVLERRGSLSRVSVYPPGSSERDNVNPAVMWIDLDAADQCDAGPASLTELACTDEGALFLIANQLPRHPS